MTRMTHDAAAALAPAPKQAWRQAWGRTWSSDTRARVESRVLLGILVASAATVAVSVWCRHERPAGAPASFAAAPAEPADSPRVAAASIEAAAVDAAPRAGAASSERPGSGDDWTELDGRSRPADRARWREKDFYDELVSRPVQLERAKALLESAAPRPEKIALLRAAYDQRCTVAPELFELAIARLPDDSDAAGESVPRSMIHWLGRRAPRDAAARGILERCALDARPAAAPELRIAAARALIAASPDTDRSRLRRRFAAERDEAVHASAMSALDGVRDDLARAGQDD